MKIHNITEKNIDKFFALIDSCEGKVELVCEDFRLNLKSSFAQYVSVAKIFFNKEVKEIELLAYNQNDLDKLIRFLIDDSGEI